MRLPASAPRAFRRLAAATVLASAAASLSAPRAAAAPAPPPRPAPGPAPAPAFGETVFSRFDLLGWRKLGILTLQTPPLDVGGSDAMLDNDPRTLVSAPGLSEGEFLLEFSSSQIVRRVAVATGSEAAALVSLTVIEEGGRRFKAGEFEVHGAEQAVFRLLDVRVTGLAIGVERTDEGAPITLSDVEVVGQLDVVSLALDAVPETLPEGGGFQYRILGRDSLGGRPDLTDKAQLVVSPRQALTLQQGNRAQTRVQGPLSIEPRLGSLQGLMRPVLVTALDPPPPAPVVTPGLRVVGLKLQGNPPFEVFRRDAGAKEDHALGRTESDVFYDDTVEPGMAYSYAVRRVDPLDNPITARSQETRVRTHTRAPPGLRDPGRVPVLVALFVDSLQPGERPAIEASLNAARLFIYRHTLGRLVLDLTILPVPGPTPPTAGPSMLDIEQRLRQLGVRDDEFGIVYAIADDIGGDWGGFRLLGRTAGAMGRGTSVPTPLGALGPDPATAWSFTHELQHVFASLANEVGAFSPEVAASEAAAASANAGAGGLTGAPAAPAEPVIGPLPSGHFPEDFGPLGILGQARGRPFNGGEAWDGAALLLASFDGWSRLGPPWHRPFEITDTDGDGLADSDTRLPIDEARLGTRTDSADTDGDGLADFAELAAGLYRGADPLYADSDGDGVQDGADPWPLSNFAGVITKGREMHFLARVPTPADPNKLPVVLSAAWNDNALALEIVTDRACDAFVDLVGSDLGRWETDVNTGTAGAPASDVWAGPARIALRANTEPTGVYVGGRPVPDAFVAGEHDVEGRFRLLAVLPRHLGPGATDVLVPLGAPRVDGLRLQPGAAIGLAITVRPSRTNDPAPFEAFTAEGDWTSLFETHHLMEAQLQD